MVTVVAPSKGLVTSSTQSCLVDLSGRGLSKRATTGSLMKAEHPSYYGAQSKRFTIKFEAQTAGTGSLSFLVFPFVTFREPLAFPTSSTIRRTQKYTQPIFLHMINRLYFTYSPSTVTKGYNNSNNQTV